jgi:adenine-specific DNA-methyltransferase
MTNKPCTQPLMGYRFPEETMQDLLERGKILFGETESKLIELKLYAKEYRAKLSSVIDLDGRKGANELKKIFTESNKLFEHPKPSELLEELLSFVTSGSDIILDSFAGTGSTAHAIMKLNIADGGNRKFILVEMMDYAETITAERVRRVIDGYADVPGTGGGFDYYKLGEPLLLENGDINESVGVEKIREYIWYTETRSAYVPQERTSYYLGERLGVAYYFYYEKETPTTLDLDNLRVIKVKAEQYVIYADICALSSADLKRYGITFKKIPRDIKRF